MLDGLDDIAWEALTHAYGSAADVPGLLRDLTVPARFEAALEALHGNVLHQGTRYEATPHVVPFAVALIEAGVQPVALMQWLAKLVAGHRNPVNPGLWCDGDRLHWPDGTTEPVTDAEADLGHGVTPLLLARIWHGVAAATPLWQAKMIDDAPDVRAAAVGLLGLLVSQEGVTAALTTRLAEEPDGHVRGALCCALCPVAPEVVEERLADPHPAARFFAAVSLPEHEDAADILLSALDGVDGREDGPELAAAILLHAPREARVAAIPALCRALQQHAGFALVPIVRALLAAAFPEPIGLYPTPVQEPVLRALLSTPYPWRIGNLAGDFQAAGLDNRHRLAKLLEVPLPDDDALLAIDGGLLHARMGLSEQAVARFDAVPWVSLFDRHPDGFDALLHYARLLSALPDRARDAAQVWGDIAERSAEPVLPLLNRAILIGRGAAREDGAAAGVAAEVVELTDVTDAFPDAPQGWHALGIALRHAERFEDALAATDKALALRPDYRDALWNRGSVLCLLGRLEAALDAVERCAAIDPTVVPHLRRDADFTAIATHPRFQAL